ncbi:MAG: FAD:protein FMN transferase [Clostridia bacterium]|nr:FAD:protein FMN transferase [Clostridia bacterium]
MKKDPSNLNSPLERRPQNAERGGFIIPENKKTVEKIFFAMGTANSVTVYEDGLSDALDACRDMALGLHEKASIFDGKSDVSKINSNAGIRTVGVSDEIFGLIKRCAGYNLKSGGKFDVTSGPAAALWKNALKIRSLPSDEEIKKAAELIRPRDVMIDAKEKKIGLKRKGEMIDLGGVAKGYAADEAKKILSGRGAKRALINFGGTVWAVGKETKVGIRDPFSNQKRAFASLRVENKAVVTSGYYEQFVTIGGRIYHHIIDPGTGRPCEPVFAGITLIGDCAEELDAFSTALFSMTAKEAFGFLEENSLDAVFVTKERQILISDGIKNRFSLI